MYSGRSYDLDSRDEGRFREGDRHSRSRRHGDRRPRDDDLYQNMSHPNNRQCYKFYIDDPRRYEKCIRCHRKIYPTEKSDVGVALHKSCFRCSECNVTLTLHGYIIAKPENANRKGVYCKTHAPKPVRYALDETAMEIMNAVKSQQILKNPNLSKQVQTGWQYDAKAIEFQHARHLIEQNKRQPTKENRMMNGEPDEDLEGIREVISPTYSPEPTLELDLPSGNVRELTECFSAFSYRRPSLDPLDQDIDISAEVAENAAFDSEAADSYWANAHAQAKQLWRGISTGGASEAGTRTSDSDTDDSAASNPVYEPLHHLSRPRGSSDIYPQPYPLGDGDDFYPPQSHPSPSADAAFDKARLAEVLKELYRAESLAAQQDDMGRKSPEYQNFSSANSKRTLRGECFKEKRFIKQNELELRQRHEHGEMFRDFERSREEEMRNLEDDLRRQMDKAVKEVIRNMDQGLFQGDLRTEKLSIERHFHQLKEERMRHLLDKLNLQERMRIDEMIDRQTSEMLVLMDKKAPAQLPPPEPPTMKKVSLYESPHIFDEVDFNAIQVAQLEQGSFTELIYELTKDCGSQLEKVRSIFRWITVKDLNQMIFSEELTEDNPYYFLKGIKYGLESYHELFKRLCSYAGLKVRIIRGYSKSAGYKPGMPLTTQRFRNTWAVVHVDSAWRFIDCHWGARHVTNCQDEENSAFCYELDEFFFLTDPEEHIYMHYPDEEEWQLMEKPVTQEEFIGLPILKSQFFLYGLQLPANCQAVVETDTGKVEISLHSTEEVPLAFNTRIESENEALDGYCIHHWEGSEVIFNLNLPRKGTFYFTIFACDTDKADSYSNICSFKIKCSKVDNVPFCKFPRVPHGYGPTALAAQLGMRTEKYQEHYLVCQEDKVILNVRFGRTVKVSHRLMSHEYDEHSEVLTRLVFMRYREGQFVSYLLRFPQRGVYLFSVFAAPKDNGDPMLECACRYLIQCNVNPKITPRPFPKTQPTWMKCRLHEPTSGDLKASKNVKFKLEVAGAGAVAVIVGQQWYYLRREGTSSLWEGIAFTGRDDTGTVDVYACYGKSKDFYPLLEYRVVEDI